MNGKYFVEYSATQQCFHVDTITASINNNLRAFSCGRPTDFVPLQICDTKEKAHQAAKALQGRLNDELLDV